MAELSANPGLSAIGMPSELILSASQMATSDADEISSVQGRNDGLNMAGRSVLQ